MNFPLEKVGPELNLALQLPADLRMINPYFLTTYNPTYHTFEAVVKYHGNLKDELEKLGVQTVILSEKYAIITFYIEILPKLLLVKEIEFMEKPRLVSMFLDASIVQSCITAVQVQSPCKLKGKGTIIGIIDSGIDYTHPDFINDDGTSRILNIWDQTIDGNPPKGFKIGTEYSNEIINEALNTTDIDAQKNILPHEDTNRHGTHVAGIAAGNGRASNGAFRGVAPESNLIVVKLAQISTTSLTRTTEIMRGLKYIIEKAEGYNMPVAVNISYGTNEGQSDGTSLFDSFIDDMSYKWKTSICVAAGNEGSSGHHKTGIVNENSMEEIEFVTSGGINSLIIEIWKLYTDKFDIEIISPSGYSTGQISFSTLTEHYLLGNIIVYIEFADATPFSENESILIALFAKENVLTPGLWKIRLYPISTITGKYTAKLLLSDIYGRNTYFLTSTLENSITSPASAKNVICVSGYDYRSNKISYFSSRGTIPYQNKPDLVAPAENIMTPAPNGGYDALSGTSIACPYVTGSSALLMEWGIVRKQNPYLYGQKIKACLKLGARRDKTRIYPNYEWGYGRLCLSESFRYLIKRKDNDNE